MSSGRSGERFAGRMINVGKQENGVEIHSEGRHEREAHAGWDSEKSEYNGMRMCDPGRRFRVL